MTDQQLNERVRSVVEAPLAAAGFEVVDVERQGPVLRVTVDLRVAAGDQGERVAAGDQGERVAAGDQGERVAAGDQGERVAAGDQGERSGIDLDGVTEATRLVSDLLDQHDLVGARTTLEVSSPGLERTLRTPAHFARFVGTEVAVKLRPGTDGERRLSGVLEAADDDGVVVAGRRLPYADIDRARTVFVWPATSNKRMGRAS